MTDQVVTFDVEGLKKDLGELWMHYARNYAQHPDEYIRGMMNCVSTVERAINKKTRELSWKQGSLLEIFESLPREEK